MIGAGRGGWWPGVLAAAVLVGLTLSSSWQRAPGGAGVDVRLIGVALALGLVIDGGLAGSGWLRHAAAWPSPHWAPVWILAVRAAFAMTVTRSLGLLQQHPWVALWLGAIGGVLAYLGAARGWGAVTFVETTPAVVALALAWAVAMPLLAVLARHRARQSESLSARMLAAVCVRQRKILQGSAGVGGWDRWLGQALTR